MIDGEILAIIALRAGLSERVFDRIAGELGRQGRTHARQFAAMSAVDRKRRVAQGLAKMSSPLPESLRLLHRDWIEAALADEPEAQAILARPSLAPFAVWVVRRAFVALPLQAAPTSEVVAAMAWLRDRGALALASALRGRRPALAAAMVQLGDRRTRLQAAARDLDDGAVSAVELRPAIAACQGVDLSDEVALERIGIAIAAADIAADPTRWQPLCFQMPRRLGLAMAALWS